MNRYLIYTAAVFIIAQSQFTVINGQILDDTVCLEIIREGIDDIYNLRFEEAREMHSKISLSYEGHPVTYLIHGLIVYWENYPLLPASPEKAVFEEDMRKCFELCEDEQYLKQHEGESTLANVCSRGLLLVFYTDNHLSREVIPLAGATYRYIMRSFDFNRIYPDLYYFTGLYNYYRDAYPRYHPVYKAVAALFPPGDMETGLKELNICAQEAILLKAEANSILSWIFTNYENDFETALKYTSGLTELYPQNLFFKGLHIKNLLLLKRYEEAEIYLDLTPEEAAHPFYSTQTKVFRGIIQEKKYRDFESAEKLYTEALNEFIVFGNYANEFSAYSCFGLSRICEARGDKAGKRNFHRRAMNLASFKKINFD